MNGTGDMNSVDNKEKQGEVKGSPTETPEATPKPKKTRRKLAIGLGVATVIVVVAGIGFWTWHEQPSFCNAVCHSPMDSYVEGYYSQDDTKLVVAHSAASQTCLNCHEPSIDEQVTELGKWVTGDFKDPLPMQKIGTEEFCARSGCHDTAELAAATENYQGSGRNPHDSHYGDQLDCNSCHHVHRESTLYCGGCHTDMPVPDGWKQTA